jgi:hypothetical protein
VRGNPPREGGEAVAGHLLDVVDLSVDHRSDGTARLRRERHQAAKAGALLITALLDDEHIAGTQVIGRHMQRRRIKVWKSNGDRSPDELQRPHVGDESAREAVVPKMPECGRADL